MKNNPRFNGMGSRGFTLVELIVAVTVVMILAVALNFSFQGWMGGYNVESEIKQVQSDLLDARSRAMQYGRIQWVRCTTPYKSYYLWDDTSDGTNFAPDGDGTLQTSGARPDTVVPGYPKTVRYADRTSVV
jgi:prepilin-type N-terminal cleavage/methylation domain-containing protein